MHGQFPKVRLRRSRRTASIRRLVAETSLSAGDLIYPVFLLDGEGRTEAVPSMPGVSRRSIDGLIAQLAEAVEDVPEYRITDN
jgi:porphobilinogen synthase